MTHSPLRTLMRHPLRGALQRRSAKLIIERDVDIAAQRTSGMRRPRRHGMRIVVASDLHTHDSWFDEHCVRHVVERINAQRDIDLVVLLGDFVCSDARTMQWASPLLAQIQAPSFAVLGNHDHWAGPDIVATQLRAAGVTLLTNASHRISDELYLAGLDSCWTLGKSNGGPDVARAFADIPLHDETGNPARRNGTAGPISDEAPEVVVLGHEPWLATRHAAFLHLAGHTHCGQVRSPLLGNLVSGAWLPRYSRPWPYWLHRLPESRFCYTTAGLGYSTVDFRLFCPPEIVTITI